MRQYKIWNVINNPSYNSPKSFGANEYATTSVKVGSSSRNSFDFVDHEVKHFINDEGKKVFQFIVDGVVIKEGVQKTKDASSDIMLTINKVEQLGA